MIKTLLTMLSLTIPVLNGMENSPNKNPKIDFSKTEKSILERPVAQLIKNRMAQGVFTKSCKGFISPTQYESAVHEFEKTQPLFLTDECANHEKKESCPLNRLMYPTKRDYFEQTVSAQLIAQISKTSDFVKYTTVNARQLFSDLRILMMALKKHPTAHLAIDVVDVVNIVFDAACKAEACNHSVESIIDQKVDKALEDNIYTQLPDRFKSADHKNKIIETFSCARLRQNQLINTLKNTFPQADLKLSLYNQIDHYLEHFQDDHFLLPDVIGGHHLDRRWYYKTKNGASLAFHELAVSTLLANPSSFAFNLSEKNGGILEIIHNKSGSEKWLDIDVKVSKLTE
jgi:hypothetical protein